MKKINPNKVADETLEQILGDDSSCAQDLDDIRNAAKAIVFSRYRQRRINAWKQIKQLMGGRAKISHLAEEGTTYVYLHWEGIEAYILVGKYSDRDPLIEEAPTEQEYSSWKSQR